MEEEMTLSNDSDEMIVICPGEEVEVEASRVKFGGMNETVVKDVR